MSLGVQWPPSIVFGWFASVAVWHGLSCCVRACGGLLGISGMKVWGRIYFCWPVFCCFWAILSGRGGGEGGAVVMLLFLPVTTLIN